MKLPSKHRCPWCGEIVEDIKNIKHNHIRKCGSCGHEYALNLNGAVYKISDYMFFFSVIAAGLSMSHISIPIIYGIFCVFMKIILDRLITYDRFDDDDIRFTIKKYKAKFTFEHDKSSPLEYLKTRIFLSDKAIIPICFADENDTPLSHVICISMEDTRRITNTKYECVFSFLPLSAVSYDASKTCDFYLFDGDRKRVGKGRIMAEYNKFV